MGATFQLAIAWIPVPGTMLTQGYLKLEKEKYNIDTINSNPLYPLPLKASQQYFCLFQHHAL